MASIGTMLVSLDIFGQISKERVQLGHAEQGDMVMETLMRDHCGRPEQRLSAP